MKKTFLLAIAMLLIQSCGMDEDVVNIYSGRHYQVDENLFREFTEQTGIRVNLVKADTDQLLNRLEMEGANTPADLLITADAGRLVTATAKGLLQPIDSEMVDNLVPAEHRDPDNHQICQDPGQDHHIGICHSGCRSRRGRTHPIPVA